MIKKKICVLGAFAVGKTSLIERYVKSVFSDKYHTTIGVKTDQKDVEVDGEDVRLIIWDINGEDDYQHVKPSYLLGASGYFLVADGTRKETLEVAEGLQKLVFNTIGNKSFYLLINKSDLMDEWEITENALNLLSEQGWKIIKTSAKLGQHVDDAFLGLCRSILQK
jgi:small GTP-binding protein